MSRKHAELERELIEELEPRTGRPLAAWMAAIEAAGLDDKNAIIDWLRPQGLTFAHASWLERIHNNGGRPIYLDASGSAPASTPPPALQPPERTIAPRPPVSPTAPTPQPLRQSHAPPLATSAASSIETMLARGKGLRPLADMLLRELHRTLPGARLEPAGDLVSIANPAELAVLLIGPRELRLGLALREAPPDAGLVRARPPGAGPHVSHVAVLTDARQVAAPLMDLVRLADSFVNSRA